MKLKIHYNFGYDDEFLTCPNCCLSMFYVGKEGIKCTVCGIEFTYVEIEAGETRE